MINSITRGTVWKEYLCLIGTDEHVAVDSFLERDSSTPDGLNSSFKRNFFLVYKQSAWQHVIQQELLHLVGIFLERF